jgi:glyoxylate/hydroxypyruvate reductase A
MKKNSCFINAGRGDHVVEEDLLESCKTGHISNAILDVYKQEPLPQNHRFWKQENIRIWPHVAAETNPQTAAKQIANAIKCINEGKSPPNMVDKKLGY